MSSFSKPKLIFFLQTLTQNGDNTNLFLEQELKVNHKSKESHNTLWPENKKKLNELVWTHKF